MHFWDPFVRPKGLPKTRDGETNHQAIYRGRHETIPIPMYSRGEGSDENGA